MNISLLYFGFHKSGFFKVFNFCSYSWESLSDVCSFQIKTRIFNSAYGNMFGTDKVENICGDGFLGQHPCCVFFFSHSDLCIL